MLVYLLPSVLRITASKSFSTSHDAFFKTSPHLFKNKNTDCSPYFSIHSSQTFKAALKVLRNFENDKNIKKEAIEHGITKTLFHRSMRKFKRVCLQESSSKLTLKLRFILHEIASGHCPLNALLPFFLEYSDDLYPALKQHEKLKELSDLSEPTLWYPKARSISRNIIFHAGPTNSGKTYSALNKFFEAETAVYCSPLRLLAREICEKSRNRGVSCDMITGDSHDYHHGAHDHASKVACTVEMTDLNKRYEVAVIDEIQMLSDIERGWAWTRAFLGLCAEEIHVCGEERALDVIASLTFDCNDKLTVQSYKRLGKLRVKKNPVENIEKLHPGDCVVCFNRGRIFSYKDRLADIGKEAAIIYGDLPPVTKQEEARKFNDPQHPCNILITTDAIGMGLNLNIRRIIFDDIEKMSTSKRGDKRLEQLTSSHALQISGRAGRYGSQYPDGSVTAMHAKHQDILLELLGANTKAIKKAGLHPSFERLKSFAQAMHSTSLYDVLTVFVSMCETDKSLYFVCSLKDCQELAEALKHVKLSMRDMYTFCLSPVSSSRSFVMSALIVYAEFYAKQLSIDTHVVKAMLNWPPKAASNRKEMSRLEDMHECLRLYLWLSYRFPDIFPSRKQVSSMRSLIDKLTLYSIS